MSHYSKRALRPLRIARDISATCCLLSVTIITYSYSSCVAKSQISNAPWKKSDMIAQMYTWERQRGGSKSARSGIALGF